MTGERELVGRAIMVTGASRGIGAATAVACARAGAKRVMLLARSPEGLEETARQVRKAGAQAVACACDITVTGELESAVDEFGAVDVLVNCAGENQPQPFAEVEEPTFERLWRLNVGATFFATQAVARRMLADKRAGVIVNISSQMGHVGAPLRTVYCTTKHAIEGLTKALAVELGGEGIRVVSVAPTFVRTSMTAAQLEDPTTRDQFLGQIPLQRFATTDDVAAAVVFAASDRAALLTGTSLVIDGGWTAK